MPQGPIPASIARSLAKALGFGVLDQQSSQWMTLRHGKLYAAAYGTPAIASPAAAARAGALFSGSSQAAGQATSAGLATTYTGLCLSNPGSGAATPSTVNLKVRRVFGLTVAAPSGLLALGLISGWAAAGITVHTTSLNSSIISRYIGAAATGSPPIAAPASVANLDSQCTLVGTPQWDKWLAVNALSAQLVSFAIDLEDDTIIPPGGYLAIGSNVAGPALLGTYEWEEIAP